MNSHSDMTLHDHTEDYEQKKIWDILQTEDFNDYHFERNKHLGPITIDFFCEVYRFAIVVDRDEDFSSSASLVDPESQTEMEQMGIVVVRFRKSEVRKNLYIIKKTIEFWLKDRELRYL